MSKNYRAELVGVFGDPVEDNPTGVMEEAAFAACGLNYRYLTMKVTKDDFDDAMKALRALHMKGINLTMPHKLTVIPYLDELSEAARIIGAVNTVNVREDGTLFGENTDGKGFVEALGHAGITLPGKKVLILGAGGAARAIAVECALAGAAKVDIANRTLAKAEELSSVITQNTNAESSAVAWTPNLTIPFDIDILINATSIGFAPNVNDKPDIDYSTVRRGLVVSDVVFYPCETRFLEVCKKQGAVTVNGLGMLACQGARNFTIWTGVEAPLQIMEDTLREQFE